MTDQIHLPEEIHQILNALAFADTTIKLGAAWDAFYATLPAVNQAGDTLPPSKELQETVHDDIHAALNLIVSILRDTIRDTTQTLPPGQYL